ncbi:YbaK/EbsC family protein [Halobellus ruber]|uniref:YbaK/EbsC family protein n=1 Tax=Halobellus ruber TaxID=2761102 RepID=A0A7J9SEF7_9EURY|nr:YbaK/EbsC family protein [Halobellus ruber]MBB6645300.1 YbaK/EbsC family protein [Halobellus ruber]
MDGTAEEFRRRATDRYGIDPDVETFPEGTETAADAAAAVGCDVAQIASSLVFDADGDLVVVVTSGANRVSEPRLADHVGADGVSMAAPGRVRDVVGWAVGGVPPICHDADLPVYLDSSLLDHDTVWAAAGAPTAVFPIAPAELAELADADAIAVSE